jgi:hypothetical protein
LAGAAVVIGPVSGCHSLQTGNFYREFCGVRGVEATAGARFPADHRDFLENSLESRTGKSSLRTGIDISRTRMCKLHTAAYGSKQAQCPLSARIRPCPLGQPRRPDHAPPTQALADGLPSLLRANRSSVRFICHDNGFGFERSRRKCESESICPAWTSPGDEDVRELSRGRKARCQLAFVGSSVSQSGADYGPQRTRASAAAWPYPRPRGHAGLSLHP